MEVVKTSAGLQITKSVLTIGSLLILLVSPLAAGCSRPSQSAVFILSPSGLLFLSLSWLLSYAVISAMRAMSRQGRELDVQRQSEVLSQLVADCHASENAAFAEIDAQIVINDRICTH